MGQVFGCAGPVRPDPSSSTKILLIGEDFMRTVEGRCSHEFMSYVVVLTTVDGRMVLYRDYWNPLVALELLESS